MATATRVFEPCDVGPDARRQRVRAVQAGSRSRPITTRGANEAFVRTALGYTLAQDAGSGRAWTPMVEVLGARREGGAEEWDVVPQVQVSLSKLQHVLLNVGVRMPLTSATDATRAGHLFAVGLVRRRPVPVLEVALRDASRRSLVWLSGRRLGGRSRCLGRADAQRRRRTARRGPHRDLSLFAHSDDCSACHNNLTPPAGEDVSIGVAWRATMMANSARDPYWQASRPPRDDRSSDARRRHPGRVRGCHMPMAQRRWPAPPAARARCSRTCRSRQDDADCSASRPTASPAPSATRSQRTASARPRASTAGSCDAAAGRRRRAIFGPYDVDAGRQTIMRSVTGFEQEAGAAHPRVGAVRVVPHADHAGARTRRRGHRLAAGADELPGVAAQRVRHAKAAQLPVVPHAAARGPGADRLRARRRPRRRWRATPSSAATPSCCAC